MDILFLDNPTLPLKKFLAENNCNCFKLGTENPLDITCIYTHMTTFLHEDYPRLKYVICPQTGVIHLGKLPDQELFYLDNKAWLYENIWSTAEHTFTLMLRLMRGLCRDVNKKTIGIIGFGRVGQQLFKLLQGWDVNIIWYDTKEKYYDLIDRGTNAKYIEDIFLESDVISLHLPENDLTKKLIGRKYLDLCTKQPIILNTARASIMNYPDLLRSFESGKISGFGLDIDIDYVKSLVPKTFSKMEDLAKIYRGAIITPHVAGKSIEARIETDRYVFNKLFKMLGGKLYETNFGLL